MSRSDGLYTAVQRQVINQMLKAAASDDKNKIIKAFRLAEKITPDQWKGSVRFVGEKIEDDHPALNMARHVTTKLSPRCRDRFIECLIVNTLLRGVAKRSELLENTGMRAPTTILMSPTMRCNLTCDGCYAAEYSPDQDLDRSLMQKIVDEGNDMGVYLFTLLGGEPFMWDELLDFARENKDAYFQVFTNGTLLDHDTIDELAQIGNIAPMLSLEGSPSHPTHAGVRECTIKSWRSWTISERPAWCSATPAPWPGTTGEPSSATSSSIRWSPRAPCSPGTSSTCRSGASPTRP